MEHTEIVTALELEQYASRRDSEATIPELISLLISVSASELSVCRIPYGDAVNQPGWDGLVETSTGFRQFVPSSSSYWEIGTGNRPQAKATDDFKKRTRSMPKEKRQTSSYVFVTPRGWPEPAQSRWMDKRRKFEWHQIKILDSPQITDWLRDFPALGRWLLKKIGGVRAGTGLATPAEHWENLSELVSEENRSLFYKVFLVGRDRACEQLSRLFQGEISQLLLAAESQQDTEDFVAAFLESSDSGNLSPIFRRCLFVKDAEAWLSFANLRIPHILVAHPKIGIESEDQLLAVARKNGHRVIIPVSGTWAHGNENLIQLRSPSASVLESTLRECAFEGAKARELGGAGALSLAALKRHLLGLGSLPPYATWENARVLAQSGLFGKWNGANQADREAMEIMLGKPYGEWIEIARNESMRSETPLIQRNDEWKLICRGEAWNALGPRIVDADLAGFEKLALAVLGERDQKFDLPVTEQYLATVRGKVLSHSSSLRDGVAESLALLGSRPGALTSCFHGRPEAVANTVVRKLLTGADWVRWASISNHLPLLAEASPREFMNAVEAALDQTSDSPLIGLFSQESSGIGGWNYTSGLLWALENLAWHPDYLVRATTLLGGLAKIDPGGSWANRPANSLNHIFLPWYPQTIASISLRKSAIEALLSEQPEVGWKTLIGLLPSTHSMSSGSHKPSWRAFIPSDWKEKVTNAEYWAQVSAYADMSVAIAATNLSKLTELIDRLPDLPRPAHSKILEHLASDAVFSLAEGARLPVWESLIDLATKHRKFSDTAWAMPSELVNQIEKVAAVLAPRAGILLYRRLFSERDFDLYEEKDSYEDQARLLDIQRKNAIAVILKTDHLAGVLQFAQQVESPRKVGFSLGTFESLDIDSELLPHYLVQSEPPLNSFIESFVWGRYQSQKWGWVDQQLKKPWDDDHKLALLTFLPFESGTWVRAEKLLPDDPGRYWQRASANPWALDAASLIEAAEKLVRYGRPHAAIDCLYLLTQKNIEFPTEIATKALIDGLGASAEARHSDRHHIQEVISWLQNHMPKDSSALFDVEWAYLPLLDEHYGDVGPKTIERRLASSPGFFCEAIAAVFQSDKEEIVKHDVTDAQSAIAQNAYRLLHRWKRLPGVGEGGDFNGEEFAQWLSAMKEISTKTGHFRIAMDQMGQALRNSPPDPDGLWIHKAIADALNAKDSTEMRNGFRVGLFNLRGVFSPSGGEEERRIATSYRDKAEALSRHGFHRLADEIRELADEYQRDAEREANGERFGSL